MPLCGVTLLLGILRLAAFRGWVRAERAANTRRRQVYVLVAVAAIDVDGVELGAPD